MYLVLPLHRYGGIVISLLYLYYRGVSIARRSTAQGEGSWINILLVKKMVPPRRYEKSAGCESKQIQLLFDL